MIFAPAYGASAEFMRSAKSAACAAVAKETGS